MNLIRRVEEQTQRLQSLVSVHGISNEGKSAIREFIVLRSKVNTWQREGCITFKLSDKLVEAFRDTDIPMDMCPEECKYPFDCFMVESTTPMFHTNIEGLSAPIYSILFMNNTVANKMRKEQKDSTFLHNDGSFSDSMTVKWLVALTAFYEVSIGGMSSIESMVFDVGEGKTLATIINENNLASPTMLPLDTNDVKGLLNIFFNTVLYINDPVRNKAETQKERTEGIRESKGGKFIPSKCIILKPPADYVKKESESTGKKLDKRFRVRGHWRNQALGHNLSERSRRWIKPYWKGPELSEVISKQYSVQ